MRALIGGGTGFVGRHLTKALQEKGYKVTKVSRKTGPDTITWKDINKNGIPDDVTAVVNLAGANILNPLKRWNQAFKDEVVSSRVETTKTLANAIVSSKIPPKVFATISGVAIYKPNPTLQYTEDSDVEPYDFLSQLVVDWEQAAKLPESHSCRQVTVRSGVVLGRDGGMIQQLYFPFYLGLGGTIGLRGDQWLPWIHVSDLAGIFMHAINNDNVRGILNGTAESATNADFTKAFAGALCRPAIFPTPGFVMNIVFGSDRAKVILEGQNVKPQKTLESGYQYKYFDVKSACKNCVS
ncbi:epimerase family protein SDR39U1-like [Mytilus galloprovincialis]|uniref:epimerase family protein SDR39U1-like n=1 Tax=Mytilus galloprovincialis TaxID=29158 RepID=UPI003F7CCF69